MEEEQKLCLAEPTLELLEKLLLQVQTQLLEEMQDLEALAAEVVQEATVEVVCMQQHLLNLNQEEREATVEREVMEAVAEEGAKEGEVVAALQEQEVQEVLAALEEEVEAAVVLVVLEVVLEKEILLVMVQQEAMAEGEEVEALVEVVIKTQFLVAVALVALD